MSSREPAHYPLGELRWTGDNGWMPHSRALICRNDDVETGIVFVHGWGGSAGDTWEAFPRAIRSMMETAHADAFFVDYPSRQHSVAFCAAQFTAFLLDILRTPAATIVNPSLPPSAQQRPTESSYRRILIVAHSMGAVIARRAVVDLDRDELKIYESSSIRLLFFAPAHRGSSIPLLIGSGLGLEWLPGAALVGASLTLYYRSLQDLAEGSECLTSLAEDCKAMREQRMENDEDYRYLLAEVYHAQSDKVVNQNQFDHDHRMRPIMRRDHRSICKPDAEYATPVSALRSLL